MFGIAVIFNDQCIHVCIRHAKLKTKEHHDVYTQCLNVSGLACVQHVHVALYMLISAPLTVSTLQSYLRP